MSRAAQIRRLEAEIRKMEDERAELKAQLTEMPALQAKLEANADLEAAYENLLRENKDMKQELELMKITHDQDVKARANTALTLKLAKTKSDRYQRKMLNMTARLSKAEAEVERLLKLQVDVDQAHRMVEHAESVRRKTEAAATKEAADLELERKLRVKELAIHKETLEELDKARLDIEKEQMKIKVLQKDVLMEQGRTAAVRRELVKERKIKSIRQDELRSQKEEIARLEELVKRQQRMYEIQQGEIFQWNVRYRRLRDAFRIVQKRLTDTMRALPKTNTNKGELVSPAESSLREIAREREEKLAMTDPTERLRSATHAHKTKQRTLEVEPVDMSASRRLRMSKSAGGIAASGSGEWGTGTGKGPGLRARGGRMLPGVRSSRGRVVGFKEADPPPLCENEKPGYMPGNRSELLKEDVSTGVGLGVLSAKAGGPIALSIEEAENAASIDKRLRDAGYEVGEPTLQDDVARADGQPAASKYVTSGDAGAGTGDAIDREVGKAHGRKTAKQGKHDDDDLVREALGDLMDDAAIGLQGLPDSLLRRFGGGNARAAMFEGSQDFLEDEALVSAVLDSERRDMEARSKARANKLLAEDAMRESGLSRSQSAASMMSMGSIASAGRTPGGAPSSTRKRGKPPRTPHTPGSMFVGSGLGLKKEVEEMGTQGSARQMLAKLMAGNPEMERLRELEDNKRV